MGDLGCTEEATANTHTTLLAFHPALFTTLHAHFQMDVLSRALGRALVSDELSKIRHRSGTDPYSTVLRVGVWNKYSQAILYLCLIFNTLRSFPPFLFLLFHEQSKRCILTISDHLLLILLSSCLPM